MFPRFQIIKVLHYAHYIEEDSVFEEAYDMKWDVLGDIS